MTEDLKIEELTQGLKRYINTNCELIKFEATERSSVIGSGVISGLLIGLVAMLFVLFISLGAGFYLSARFENLYSGFAVVAGFYFLLGIILVIGRKKLMERPLRDKIIRKIFSKN